MNTSAEDRAAMADLASKATFKSILSAIPVAGPILSEVLFEYRSKVKQDRINRFANLLMEEFSLNLNVNLNDLKSEEFSDLFENVLNKVSRTKAERKQKGFKNLLVHGMKLKEDIEDCEIFADLLLEISEIEIQILSCHRQFLFKDGGLLERRNLLQREAGNYKNIEHLSKMQEELHRASPFSIVKPRNEEDINRDIEQVNSLLNKYRETVNANYFQMLEGKLKFSIQRLYNKGLLVDEGVGAFDTRPFEIMAITDFGRVFLSYIEID